MVNRNAENKVVVNLPLEAVTELMAIGNREAVQSHGEVSRIADGLRAIDTLQSAITDENCNESYLLPSQTDLVRAVGVHVREELKAFRHNPETRSKYNMTEDTLTAWAARRGAELVLGLLNPETSTEGEA